MFEDDQQAFNLTNWLGEKNAFEDFKDNFKRLIKGDYFIGCGVACMNNSKHSNFTTEII